MTKTILPKRIAAALGVKRAKPVYISGCRISQWSTWRRGDWRLNIAGASLAAEFRVAKRLHEQTGAPCFYRRGSFQNGKPLHAPSRGPWQKLP